jgi:hypothetical protein
MEPEKKIDLKALQVMKPTPEQQAEMASDWADQLADGLGQCITDSMLKEGAIIELMMGFRGIVAAGFRSMLYRFQDDPEKLIRLNRIIVDLLKELAWD